MNYDKYLETKSTDPSHLITHGDPGSGKSTLVSKLAEQGFKLKWLSTDNGHKILEKLSPEIRKTIEIFILPDTVDFPVASVTVPRIFRGGLVTICDNHGQVDCGTCKKEEKEFSSINVDALALDEIVVVDTIKQVATSYMARIIKRTLEDLKKAGKLIEYEDFKPGWDEYRAQGAAMDRVLTNIQQAKYNVVCITHSVESEQEDGNKKLFPLVGSGPFSRNVGGYFDHIIYCELFNKGHKFGSSTGYKASVISKSRTDIKVEELSEPTLKPFFDGTIGKPPVYGTEATKKAVLAVVQGASGKTAAEMLAELKAKK